MPGRHVTSRSTRVDATILGHSTDATTCHCRDYLLNRHVCPPPGPRPLPVARRLGLGRLLPSVHNVSKFISLETLRRCARPDRHINVVCMIVISLAGHRWRCWAGIRVAASPDTGPGPGGRVPELRGRAYKTSVQRSRAAHRRQNMAPTRDSYLCCSNASSWDDVTE